MTSRRKIFSFLPLLPTFAFQAEHEPGTKAVRSRWISYSQTELQRFWTLKKEADIAVNDSRVAALKVDEDSLLSDECKAVSRECFETIANNHERTAKFLQAKIESGGYWKQYLD